MTYEACDLAFLKKLLEKHQLKNELLRQCGEKTSLLQWRSTHVKPDEASYILIKYLDPQLKMVVCLPGCYERGKYSDVTSLVGETLDERYVVGWCYYPYSGRG